MSEVERKGGRLLWHQVGETLTSEILDGTFAPGERLPTEPALMKRFGVSRHTVRQALSNLEARGVVRAEQGRGTFVHRLALDYGISERTRFCQDLGARGLAAKGELLLHEVVPVTAGLAPDLNLEADEQIIHRRGIAFADDLPVELADSYYPAARFPGFAEVRARHAILSEAFAHYGISDYRRLSTEIGSRLPNAEEARLLRLPKSQPVLTIRKVDVDRDGNPLCLCHSIWPAERVSFAIQAPRDGGYLTLA